jgi:hypothetical protein
VPLVEFLVAVRIRRDQNPQLKQNAFVSNTYMIANCSLEQDSVELKVVARYEKKM